MHRIFLLPELLIHILSFLPASDLHIHASVSRYWKETLRLNLHPRLLPLCDTSSPNPSPAKKPQSLEKLPRPISSLAQDILARTTHWLNPSLLLDISDDYYFWHEGAYGNLVSALIPYLHPWLGKHVCELVGGLEEMARGEMGICFRTAMSVGDFDERFVGDADEMDKEMNSMSAYLTRPRTRSVEIFCVEGAAWDLEYGNVLRREGRREWQQCCVRIERDRGVRMRDVVDELRGVLKPSEIVGGNGEDAPEEVLLEWRFEDTAKRMLSFEWLDSTG